MNRILFGIYRVIVPKPLRTIILKRQLRRHILDHFSKQPAGSVTMEQQEIADWLQTNEVSIFPYPFSVNYKPSDIAVHYDNQSGMNYVIQDEKNLYFKKGWSSSRIKRGYSDLLREQDPSSPHRYLVPGFEVSEADVIADIGAAEGNFSLATVEKAKSIIIFEYNRDWAKALNNTFRGHSGKVEIINKMVSDRDDESHIKLDTFLARRKDVNFLKIDVDGAEKEVIGGLMETLRSDRPMRIAFCTYHNADDEGVYTRLFRECGFTVTPSYGYMIPYYDKRISSPWIRRGLIRAVRTSK